MNHPTEAQAFQRAVAVASKRGTECRLTPSGGLATPCRCFDALNEPFDPFPNAPDLAREIGAVQSPSRLRAATR